MSYGRNYKGERLTQTQTVNLIESAVKKVGTVTGVAKLFGVSGPMIYKYWYGECCAPKIFVTKLKNYKPKKKKKSTKK